MRLAHLHIPHLIPYTHSLRLQNALVERQFAYKDWLRGTDKKEDDGTHTQTQTQLQTPFGAAQLNHNDHSNPNPTPPPPPDPTLLTFSTFPTYTVGRRHLLTNPISAAQQAFLTSHERATFHASPRGGLLTYHAPGQLTAYIIADLRRHGITARCWVRLLEDSVIRTCAAWGVDTQRTDDPGVWIKKRLDNRETSTSGLGESEGSDRKICAIGVQVSRGITSHGIGLNVFDAPLPSNPVYDFSPDQTRSKSYDPVTRGYLSWGFSRIVACGLEGKSVTWLTRELGELPKSRACKDQDGTTHGLSPTNQHPENEISLESVASVFARELCYGLNAMRGQGKETVDDIYKIQEVDVLGL
ncbi:hypothetical protein ABEF95_003434 [Exophiala dermatitidis]